MGLGRSLGITEQGMSDFTYYDRFVRQTVPWVVSVSLNGQVETKVVCVAPSNVTLTSRTPQGPWPPAGGSSSTTPNGAGERVRWTGVYGLLVVGVFLFNSL